MNLIIELIKGSFFFLCLTWIAREDLRCRKIPNRMVIGLILWWGVSLAADALLKVLVNGNLNGSGGINWILIFMFQLIIAAIWRYSLSAAVIAGLVLFVSLLFRGLTGRKGIGAGDIKLFFASALYLGFEKGLYLVLLSGVMTLGYRLIARRYSLNKLSLRRRRGHSALNCPGLQITKRGAGKGQGAFAFGPFIALAAAVLYLI